MGCTTLVTYVLWLFGGWCGLHHFYLGRDRHALVWLFTFGGCFGIGWFRDLWRIPDYVAEWTGSFQNRNDFFLRVTRHKTPPFSVVRYAGQHILGNIFGYLTLMAMPAEFVKEGMGNILAVWFPPLTVAMGVYLVGNIGREKLSFKWCVIGAYLSIPWTLSDYTNISSIPFICTIVTRWKGGSWRRYREPQQRLLWRITKFIFFASLYFSLMFSAIYFNGTITTKDEETVYIRDAVNNFFKSPAWGETKDTLWQLYQFSRTYGWRRLWQETINTFDPDGENNAFKVLELDMNASQEEITARYRKLAKQWHPDKHKDPAKKIEAQDKFIEIQQAYDILSKLKTRRSLKNKKSAKNSDRTEF